MIEKPIASTLLRHGYMRQLSDPIPRPKSLPTQFPLPAHAACRRSVPVTGP
jgi:hypothetical protein